MTSAQCRAMSPIVCGPGAPMPGVIIVPRSLTVGQAIDEVLTVALASQEGEWEGQVIVVPL
jgi:hypothetical protein